MSVKNSSGDEQRAASAMDFVDQIWLAGLGAFAKTQEQGGKLFERLVKEGEKVEAATHKAADDMFEEVKGKVDAVRSKASDKLDKLEQAFQDRVARALGRLGVPTNDDIQAITRRLEALNDSIRELSSQDRR